MEIDIEDIFELTDVEEQILDKLKTRIPFREEIFGTEDNYQLILSDLVLQSRYLGLSRVFPFYNYSEYTLPIQYAHWQYRCCIELYNLADKTGFHTYSENGISFGKLTDGISKQLLEEITPHAGIPSYIEGVNKNE